MLEKWVDAESALANRFLSCLEISYQTSGRALRNFNQENFVDGTRWICFGLTVSIGSHREAAGDFFFDSLEVKFFNEDVDVAFDFDGLLGLGLLHISNCVIKLKITIILVLTHHWISFPLALLGAYGSFSSLTSSSCVQPVWVLAQLSTQVIEFLEFLLIVI